MKKVKKQFRLYDIYRYIVTGEESNIEGITSYTANKDASVISVEYEPRCSQTYFTRNEYELKQVITEVNKRLDNCMKPGRARRWK